MINLKSIGSYALKGAAIGGALVASNIMLTSNPQKWCNFQAVMQYTPEIPFSIRYYSCLTDNVITIATLGCVTGLITGVAKEVFRNILFGE